MHDTSFCSIFRVLTKANVHLANTVLLYIALRARLQKHHVTWLRDICSLARMIIASVFQVLCFKQGMQWILGREGSLTSQ